MDIVGAVEAAYRMDGGWQDWLDGVLAAASPSLPPGKGRVAYLYDASDPGRMRVTHIACEGDAAAVPPEALVQVVETADPDYVRATWRSVPCALASETPNVEQQPGWAAVRAAGIADILAVNGVNTSGRGVWVGTWLAKPLHLGAARRATFARVAAHLATAVRLRARIEDATRARAPLAPEAVIDERGKVQHAEADARERSARTLLREAALALDRARGSLRRRAPHDALREWRALVDGRWSLVDQFDSDGRRYLLARRNEPFVASFEALSTRERQVASYASFGHSNKVIAYELGISHSTVRVLVARAAAKLGAKSRDELCAIVARALEASSTEPSR